LIIKPLVPHLPNLKIEIQSRHKGRNYQATKRELEQLPYALEASYYAVRSLLQAANGIADEFRQEGAKASKIIIPGRPCEELAFMIDNFLDAARRTQNAIRPYLSKSLQMPVPKSMKDLISKIEKKSIKLPKEIEALLVRYWKNQGSGLKDYRDAAQHHCVMSSDVVLQYNGDDAFLYLSLVNNPQEGSKQGAGAFRWERPFVHAIPFVVQSFFALVEVIHNVTFVLLLMSPNAERKKQQIEFATKGVENALELYEIPPMEWFEAEIERCRKTRLLREFSRTGSYRLRGVVSLHDKITYIM
jgi:hypothetical protein